MAAPLSFKRLDSAGVRDVQLRHPGGLPADALPALARRSPLGWHLQLFIEGEQLRALACATCPSSW